MIQSPETQSRIAIYRAKALDGTLSLDDMRDAIQILRGERQSAAAATPAKRRAAAVKAIPSADDLLKELGEDL